MEVITLQGHSNPIYSVIAHPQLPAFYTAGNDKGIVEWNLNTHTYSRLFKSIKSSVYCLAIVTEYNLLLAGCNDGSILFFDLASTTLKNTITVNSPVFSLQYSESKKEVLASTANGEIIIIDPQQQKIVHRFESGKEKVRSLAFNEDLNLLATASNDKMVRLYHLDDYTFIQEFEAHDLGIGSISFSPDKRFLLTGSRDAHVKVWNINDWTCVENIPAHLFAVYQIAYHPSLPYFATASRDKSIKIWRAEDFSLFKNLSLDKGLEGHRLSVNNICWTADGKSLLSVSDDKLVKIWTIEQWS